MCLNFSIVINLVHWRGQQVEITEASDNWRYNYRYGLNQLFLRLGSLRIRRGRKIYQYACPCFHVVPFLDSP